MNEDQQNVDDQIVLRVLRDVASCDDECCVAMLNRFVVSDPTTSDQLCTSLQGNFFLHTLSLSGVLTTEIFASVTSVLENHDKLESFDLSHNTIAQIPSLCEILHTNVNLIRLNLESCNLGDTGAIDLAQHLLHHRTLDALILARNAISDGGACSLARSLMLSPLSWLDLTHNQLNNRGALFLSAAQTQRPKYLRLDLHGNDGVHQNILSIVIARNMEWGTAQRLALENDLHEPRPAGADLPPPPFPTLVRLHSLHALLFESLQDNHGPQVLWVKQGEPPQMDVDDDDNDGHDLPMVADLVPDPGTDQRDVAGWEDLCRFLTLNFHESCLVGQTEALQDYLCVPDGKTNSTPGEQLLLLRRINPAAPRGTVNRNEVISSFVQLHTTIRINDVTYRPTLCVVLPQYGNTFQFFRRDSNRHPIGQQV